MPESDKLQATPRKSSMNRDQNNRVHLHVPRRMEVAWIQTGSFAPICMKNHHHNGHIEPQPNSRSAIHEAIAIRAYELWASSGKPEDQDDAIWLEAERELISERIDL
jgi:hypothetical protein